MPPNNSLASGLLLVGHGTRSERGTAECFRLAQLVAIQLSGVPVETCFLELAEPTIDAGIAKLAEHGVQQVVVMPLLLFAAGHAKQDIPNAVAKSATNYPHLAISFLSHFGCQSEIVELSAQRFCEAQTTNEETALILVGRGSHDAEATYEMRRFTEFRAEQTPVRAAVACFLAMAEPKLEATLGKVAEQGWRRIVVQPHLLFHGDLLDRLYAAVASARTRWPEREWLVAEHLGPATQLANLIVAQFRDCLTLP